MALADKGTKTCGLRERPAAAATEGTVSGQVSRPPADRTVHPVVAVGGQIAGRGGCRTPHPAEPRQKPDPCPAYGSLDGTFGPCWVHAVDGCWQG